eukprot:4382406-Pyramimonas_sp.AAC.1
MGWKRLSLTDAKYLHRAIVEGAWSNILTCGNVPGCGAARMAQTEAFFSSSSCSRAVAVPAPSWLTSLST